MAPNLNLPEAFGCLWDPSRYKAFFGGRGSAKSHSIAGALLMQGFAAPHRVLCARETQKSIEDSVHALLADKVREIGLSDFYEVKKTEIIGRNSTRFFYSGLRNETISSIKSKEGITRVWVEEAQDVSQRSLDILIPTIRAQGSEIWFSWNPDSELDPVDRMFRGKHIPPESIIRRVSYKDNPWFPDVLKKAMEFDLETDPEKAAHIWHGEYQAAPKGAYFATLLAEAAAEGRIGRVPCEPTLEVHVSFDLGNGPNMALWFSQFVGREVRIIDYLEGDEDAANEGWPWYIRKLRERKYIYAPVILPHDARIRQRINGKGDEQTLIDAEFKTRVVDRMDGGERVKLIQGFIPKCWFDETKCADGLRALRSYRVDWDDKLKINRGPLHDWSSHASTAFGHLVQAYEQPRLKKKQPKENPGEGAWMG